MQKWKHYLLLRHFTLYTDHRNLVALFDAKSKLENNRLNRYALTLSEYSFTTKLIFYHETHNR